MPSRDDYKYLAGLFDGEGSVHAQIIVGASGQRMLQTRLSITNTNPTVLYWLENEVGGTVHVQAAGRDGRKVPLYRWVIGSTASEKFARNILPYSRMKSNQLLAYVELRERVDASWSASSKEVGSGFSQTEWKTRQRLIDKINADPYRKKMGV
jgi:hypothetical protein